MTLKHPIVSLVIALGLLVIISQSLGVVPQGQTGVRLRAGGVVATGLEPGLHFKLPFIGRIVGLDDHWITLESESQNGGRLKLQSADGKHLEVGYAVIWKIADAAAFCHVTACQQTDGARRISDTLNPMLANVFAAHTITQLLAADGSTLTGGLPGALNAQLKSLGVAVQAVYITALTLPHDQLSDVYARMRSAQADRAQDLRVQGTGDADAIRDQAQQQRASMLAQADIQAQQIRGQAQAEASAIYARAYAEDPEFFDFYMRLQAYRRAIQAHNSVIVLGRDSGFLKYFDGLKASASKPR
ncbi:MAG: protease modulator HflC [Gammaproteobacteria bacterium]|nr:protease modulator HflC [Gammaproteobacteria bacterium]MDE2345915.1 protease modulator HflC [Gammaproteobacteria bacterium]